jgi:hypothetical protein
MDLTSPLAAPSLGFSTEDFAPFGEADPGRRARAVQARLRSKLEAISGPLREAVSVAIGAPLFAHVATAGQRRVRNPGEAGVALGPDPEGWVAHPCFALLISRVGLHARVVVRPEHAEKVHLRGVLRAQPEALAAPLSAVAGLRCYDHWDLRDLPVELRVDEALVLGWAETLARPTGGLDLGVSWDRREAAGVTLEGVVEAFIGLSAVYRAALGLGPGPAVSG